MSHQGPIRRSGARKGGGTGAGNGGSSANDLGTGPGSEARSRRAKRALGVQALLEWAFRVEKVQLELPERGRDDPVHVSDSHGFGMEHVLYQRAQLGCRIDGGRYRSFSHPHEDAEVVAAAVASLPDTFGGRRMAIRVAGLARAGLTPDWMPGAVPRCVPVEVTRNQHGERAATIFVGVERVLSRGKWRSVELQACPVTWVPHPGQIEGARRAYDDWCQALGWIREALLAGNMLREFEVTEAMPKGKPWGSG
jgi:hypothetical protein